MHIEAAFKAIDPNNPDREKVLVRNLPMAMFMEDSLC